VRKLPARKLLGALIAGALFLPDIGFTIGLGEIEVNSALNQKLKADIELLSATPEDTENIIVKLASRKEFLRAGLDRPYLLNDLRFKSEVINGKPYIMVSSGSPIREPFLSFLVEVDWPNGHLLREYTVLLDPPVFMTQSASITSAPAVQSAAASSGFRPAAGGSNVIPVVPVVTPGSTDSASRPAAQVQAPVSQATADPMSRAPTTPAFVPAPVVAQQQTTINQPTGSYRIKSGDTAWSLADAMRPDQSVSVEQMMVAMLRTNPESFINENVNGLKRGYILRVPDYDQIASVNKANARAMVREQAALWRQYQQSQSAAQPVSAMQTDAMAGSAETGDSEAVASDEAYLEIVSAGSGTSTMSGKDPTQMSAQELRAELALARERVETERVEKEALQGRVNRLEQHVDKMKGMLSIEDEELSGVQSLGMPAEGEPEQIELEGELVAPQLEADVLSGETEPVTEEADAEAIIEASAETAELDSVEAADGEMTEEVAEGVSQDAVFTDEAVTEATDESPVAETMAETPDQLADAIATSQSDMVEQAPADPLKQLLNNPMMLAAAGGGLLLLTALIGLIVKRRKAATETVAPAMSSGFDDLEVLADDIAGTEVADEVAAESQTDDLTTAGKEAADFDADATTIIGSANDTVITDADAAAGAEEQPRDDVVAEADVYLAYGIYQQAEELLTQAIADNPDRDDYRLKLAETHYASKNAEAFTEVASEIKKRVESVSSPIWKKVMIMGQDLCADNPMFQGSMVGETLDVDALSPSAPEMDFDLGSAGTEDSSTTSDLDLSLGDEALELPEMDEEETQFSEAEEPVDELEFDLSDTGAVAETTAAEDEFSLDIDAAELDIDSKDEVQEITDISEESIELDDIDLGTEEESKAVDASLDVDDVDIDFGLEGEDLEEQAATPAVDEEVVLDLSDEIEALAEESSLETDLGEEKESTEVAEAAVAASEEAADDEDFDLSSLDDVDEISTKLDLARAYLDMGDHEGTRGILEEVLAEGNDEQKQEANDLIAKLD